MHSPLLWWLASLPNLEKLFQLYCNCIDCNVHMRIFYFFCQEKNVLDILEEPGLLGFGSKTYGDFYESYCQTVCRS